VRHSADACIGCQYCTWNCSYGVPQYNPERGVVGKCDMCHGRLEQGQAPACVSACPEGAIAIEIVKVAEWQEAFATSPPGRGVPVADGSVSTTRVTLMANLPPDARPVNLTHVTPEHAHWSLVFMTVLTQLSVGAFVAIWLLQLLGRPRTWPRPPSRPLPWPLSRSTAPRFISAGPPMRFGLSRCGVVPG
jgi:hypothetical protein